MPLADDAVEGGEQRVDLALPAVQLLRDQQPVRDVVRAERERRRCGRAASHSARQRRRSRSQAGGGLVALLGGLGEQLHDDRRERPRDVRDPLVGRHRLPGDVAVHPLHRIGGREGQRPVSIS